MDRRKIFRAHFTHCKYFLGGLLALQGFWGRGVVLHLFRIGTTRQTKCWEQNLRFGPRPEKTGPENGAGRGVDQILEFQHFVPWVPWSPGVLGGVKIKSQNWDPHEIKFKEHFVLFNFSIRRTPEARQNPQ